MDLVLISSITGQGIRRCVENLCTCSRGKGRCAWREDLPLCVEDKLVEAAESYLRAYRERPPEGYHLSDALSLPIPELSGACHQAFEAALEELARETEKDSDDPPVVGFLPFHPVLYHQLTREFVSPYLSSDLAKSINSYHFRASFVLSVHDDIYDIYRRLLEPNKLFTPANTREPQTDPDSGSRFRPREPLRDLHEQRLLLDWRDRELAAAKALAASLGARHFLFHQKGRLDSIWKIVGEKTRAVYFSHPISQPRRDINGNRDPDKCREPDSDRGRKFINHCQDFADRMATYVPIVEPTAIDELRLAPKWLDTATDEALRLHILPPLTARWPLGDGPHLSGRPPADLYSEPLLPVAEGTFENLRVDGASLGPLQSALSMLAIEIKRQINVRDRTLAEQCDLVIAYRPFSLPDSPEATGGVGKEIRVVATKHSLCKLDCKPALLVIHPAAEERQRRAKEFEKVWDDAVREHFLETDTGKLSQFEEEARRLIIDAPYKADVEEVSKKLSDLVTHCGLKAKPLPDDSSMEDGSFCRATSAKSHFIQSVLLETTVLQSFLAREEMDFAGFVEIIDLDTPGLDLCRRIQDMVESRREGEADE